MWFQGVLLQLSLLIMGFLMQLSIPMRVNAAWTPLVSSSDFTGIQTDIMTAAGGIVTIVLIILGLAMLVRAMH